MKQHSTLLSKQLMEYLHKCNVQLQKDENKIKKVTFTPIPFEYEALTPTNKQNYLQLIYKKQLVITNQKWSSIFTMYFILSLCQKPEILTKYFGWKLRLRLCFWGRSSFWETVTVSELLLYGTLSADSGWRWIPHWLSSCQQRCA